MQKKLYHLFLDEILPNVGYEHFCLAGFAISEDSYKNKVIPAVENLKNTMFNDKSIILHEHEVHSAETGSPFAVMRTQSTRMLYWSQIIKLFTENPDLKVFATAIHQNDLNRLYKDARDKYFISLQVLMENFVHFLELVDGVGDLILESRNLKADSDLRQHFHWLKATGTLFYNAEILQQRLLNISFYEKRDNIIGLQVADHIPNSLNRDLNGKRQRTFGLINNIRHNAYDGGVARPDRFGIKMIP